MPILNSQTVRNAIGDNYYVPIGINGSSTIPGDLAVGGALNVTGSITAGDDITATDLLNAKRINVNEVTGQLSGVTFNVNGVASGRVNSDGTNMILQGLTGTPCDIQLKCGTIIASDIQKDGADNITFTVGGPGAPETRLRKETSAGIVEYVPSLMKSTSAKSSGSTVSFTNTAEVLTNSTVVAPYTGYYQFMAQFTSTAIGSFDAGTDIMTFYADIEGGALTPIVGSINDITNVTATTFERVITGYAFANAGETIRMMHVDTGTFTITGGVLYVLWKYMGDGLGLA